MKLTYNAISAFIILDTAEQNTFKSGGFVASEFRTLIDTLSLIGVRYNIDYLPDEKKWQQVILQAGYNITVRACTVVEALGVDYLFCNGAVVYGVDEKPIGPGGLLLLSRDASGAITPRVHYRPFSRDETDKVNLDAIMAQYPKHPWEQALIAER